jgi:hypothetical protein
MLFGAVLPPQAAILPASGRLTAGKAGVVPFGALDGLDQVGLIHLSGFYVVQFGYFLDFINFHRCSSLE